MPGRSGSADKDGLTQPGEASRTRAKVATLDLFQVHIAWQGAAEVRSAYTSKDLAAGKTIAQDVLACFPSCSIREIAGLGEAPRTWRAAFLGSSQSRV